MWNGTNEFKQKVSTGIYIYQMKLNDPLEGFEKHFIETRKMLLIK